MTDEQKLWADAWVKAWAAMPDIHQGSRAKIGDKFSYTYAALPDILKAVRPVLTEHGFAVNQEIVHVAPGTLGVVTILTHKAGHSQRFGPLPMPATSDPKVNGSSITYGRRYSLSAALGIASDEDSDAGGTEPARGKAARATGSGVKPAQTGVSEAKADPYAKHKQIALEAIVAAYPGADPSVAKRLAAKHWVEALDIASTDGPNPPAHTVAAVLLELVGGDEERPF